MGKECGAWVSRRLWGGSNTNPLKTTAWEATNVSDWRKNVTVVTPNSFPGSIWDVKRRDSGTRL